MEVLSDGYEPHKFEIENGSVILSFSGWAALSSKAVDVAKGETAMSHTDSPKPASEVQTKSDGEIDCETSTFDVCKTPGLRGGGIVREEEETNLQPERSRPARFDGMCSHCEAPSTVECYECGMPWCDDHARRCPRCTSPVCSACGCACGQTERESSHAAPLRCTDSDEQSAGCKVARSTIPDASGGDGGIPDCKIAHATIPG